MLLCTTHVASMAKICGASEVMHYAVILAKVGTRPESDEEGVHRSAGIFIYKT